MRTRLIKIAFASFFSLLATQVAAIDTSAEEKTCAEIGFKPKTEKFGNCVVELYSRKGKGSAPTSAASSSIRSASQPSAAAGSRAGDGSQDDRTCQSYGLSPGSSGYSECRMRIDTARKEAQAQQARYQSEMAIYQQQLAEAERQRDKDRGLKMLELGLGMMAGGGSRGGTSSTVNIGPPPVAPSLNQNIFLPNGRIMTCTTSGNVTNCF